MSQNILQEFDRASKAYAEARGAVDAIVGNLEDAVLALKREHMADLKRAISRAAERHDTLKALIEQHPDIFTKPKTQTMNGLRFGLIKGKETIEFADEEAVVDMIEAAMPDQAPILVDVKKSVRVEALKRLPDEQLAAIGCARVPGEESPFIKPVDSEVEKAVSKLVGAAIKED